jgi:hypothetical protein
MALSLSMVSLRNSEQRKIANVFPVSGPSALADAVRTALRSEGGLGVLKGRAPVTLHVETFGM